MRELDACGIGFVADAHGRPSRDIVAGALTGLANVKHRGAVAADSLTSDGCGILTTIPRNLFPGDVGVATPEGVAITGRVQRGTSRGCSLTLDAITSGESAHG